MSKQSTECVGSSSALANKFRNVCKALSMIGCHDAKFLIVFLLLFFFAGRWLYGSLSLDRKVLVFLFLFASGVPVVMLGCDVARNVFETSVRHPSHECHFDIWIMSYEHRTLNGI